MSWSVSMDTKLKFIEYKPGMVILWSCIVLAGVHSLRQDQGRPLPTYNMACSIAPLVGYWWVPTTVSVSIDMPTRYKQMNTYWILSNSSVDGQVTCYPIWDTMSGWEMFVEIVILASTRPMIQMVGAETVVDSGLSHGTKWEPLICQPWSIILPERQDNSACTISDTLRERHHSLLWHHSFQPTTIALSRWTLWLQLLSCQICAVLSSVQQLSS